MLVWIAIVWSILMVLLWPVRALVSLISRIRPRRRKDNDEQ
ncbi:MAG: hypothetical protein OXT70_12890 [Chloroflexota bacterium]|nr:hypothetical protein [Chloroflexota bacterium]